MLLSILCVLVACGSLSPQPAPQVPSSGDPVEWSAVAIGYTPNASAEPTADSGLVRVRGAGNDIGGTRDEFFYVFTTLPSEGSVSARLWEFSPVNDDSKAGIMLRRSLEPDAPNALLHVSGAGGGAIQARTAAGAETTAGVASDQLKPGAWLRLSRWDDVVVGEYSRDGFDWLELGRFTLDLEGEAYIGLAVTSRAPGRVATAGFSDLEVVRGDLGDPPEPAEVEPPAEDEPTEPSAPPVASAWVCGPDPLSPRYEPTLFVATDGSDSNDGRSEGRPLRTLQRAADLARAGDVVWVRGGVYSADVSFRAQGSAGSPIVFESYPGECAVLDGTRLNAPQHVRFEGARFYVFRNFEVRNSRAQGIHLVDSHDIVVSNVRSHHNGLSGIQNVRGDRNTFRYFIVHDNSDGRQGNADGIGISSGRDNRIERCAAFRNSDDGIDAWQSTNTTIEYCVAFDNGFQGGDGNGFKAGGHTNGNAVLRFNVAFGNRTQGFNYNSGRGITFEHNTAYDNGYYGFIAANATLRNNLSYGNERRDWQDDGGNRQSANSWNLGIDDPGFASTDRSSPDFLALASGSGAIGRASTESGSGSADLGALPVGETLGSYLGIDLGRLLGY